MPTYPPNAPTIAMPATALPLFQSIATTGYFSPPGDPTRYPGSKLLYPVWSAVHQDPHWVTVMSLGHGSPGGYISNDPADEIYNSHSAVVVINATKFALNKTAFYRDGGQLITQPVDPNGTAGRIPGLTNDAGIDYFGAGAWIMEPGSIFYGSGGMMVLTSEDPTCTQKIGIAYAVSVNSGFGLGLRADAPDNQNDMQAVYNCTANLVSSKPCDTLTDGNKIMSAKACVFGAPDPNNDVSGCFVVLLEQW